MSWDSNSNMDSWLDVLSRIRYEGTMREPRGQICRELYNGKVIFDTRTSPLCSFNARKLNLTYAKKELIWYMQGDPRADWICDYATMWQKLKQDNGFFYSNYGQYLFNFKQSRDHKTQFEFVVDELARDQDSRRAVMVLLQPYHLFHDNVDVVCTYAMHFCIWNKHLLMTVLMRSNDAIYGLTNDSFCFWSIYQMVFAMLQEKYPELRRGHYTHMANSLHIYLRHFEMVDQIVKDGFAGFTDIPVPHITAKEVRYALRLPGESDKGEFLEWLEVED